MEKTKLKLLKKNSLKIKSIYEVENKQEVKVPFSQELLSAGFPSPAEGFIQKSLDLNELIIQHPSSTFFIRVIGNSMIKAGIFSNDILIVDRSLSVSNNKVIVARLNDEFLVKRIFIDDEKILLLADNDEYDPIEITNDMDFEVWGIVTYTIHKL